MSLCFLKPSRWFVYSISFLTVGYKALHQPPPISSPITSLADTAVWRVAGHTVPHLHLCSVWNALTPSPPWLADSCLSWLLGPISKHFGMWPWGALLCVHAQSCLTLCYPMDCSLPGSSIRGILQARILQWVAISTPGDISNLPLLCLLHCRQMTYHWATGTTNLKEYKRSQMTLLGRFCEKIITATCYSTWNGPHVSIVWI